MPRRPAAPVEEASLPPGAVDAMLGEGEGVNFGDGESPVEPAPAAPAEERTAAGEPVSQGVVRRVPAAPTPERQVRGEFSEKERAAMAAAQEAPARAAPASEDLTEIPGLPFLKVLEDCLNGLVAKHGWEAVSDENAMSLVVNMPRLYRTIRFLHARGIYGDRKDRGLLNPAKLRELIG